MPERAPELSEESFRKRRYDLVFTGSRTDLDEAGRRIEGISPALKGIAIDLLDLLLSEREKNMEQALDQVLTEKGIAASPVEAAAMEAMINSVNVYARAYVREETVRFIMHSGMPFDIFGFGWDAVAEDAGAGTVFHPGIPYGELLGLYSDSKLVLNVMPWFKNGSHDRIPTAMLNGVAVLTDHSRYLDECFLMEAGNDEKLFFYDIEHPERVGSIASEILADKERLYRTAGRGREYAEGHMTWEQTGDALLSCIFGM